MRAALITGCLAAIVISANPSSGAECSCRAKGTDYKLTEEICLSVGGQSYLARCSMVLNNTAWVKVGECPEAALHPAQGLDRLAGSPVMSFAKAQDMCEPARWSGKIVQ